MPTFDESFSTIELALGERFGRPDSVAEGLADSFAAAVAVILGQSIDAKKVAKSLRALAEAGLLEPQALAEADPAEIVDTLKAFGISPPARVLGPVRRMAAWVLARQEQSPDPLRDESISTSELREELRGLAGIGPATADEILLLAGHRGVYPVDRATYRILVRHGWLDPTAEYDEARSVMERPGHEDSETLNRLSGWFAQVGREFCKPSVAKCERCPLQPFLPEGGALEPDAY
ncbi:endonuclease III domain-containing protein [Singulisphaera acidiphila]|uniref:Putative endonuclease III-like protein n=1 Tax=Singulisphaera acidiphila (strain ATCC BAA-1392 / DSM 18658 / VKM B-2454 / MOB10) TaxID=886293 RepID=L0DJJ2_SINAD|nr:endonuclease III-like protein [Singulisphaera acidiphila]AGA29015.1 putative endonuclease III-like protein [Singulisphaera acidiphila DSM 18658]